MTTNIHSQLTKKQDELSAERARRITAEAKLNNVKEILNRRNEDE